MNQLGTLAMDGCQEQFEATLPPMTPAIGTWYWAERSGGSLSEDEQRQLWWLTLRGELRHMARRVRSRFDRTQVDLERVPVPDTALAEAAQSLCERVSTPASVRHCLRTYAWAALLGQRMQLTFDPELLFVASLLHDLGLTDHARPTQDVPCFAVSGARAAREFLRTQGVAEERALRAAECICLHVNPYVSSRHHPEARLLSAGAALDAIGARKHELLPSVRRAVLRQHPESDFTNELGCCLGAQVGSWPSTRAGFLERRFDILKRIARNRL
jgi:HD domain